MKKILLTALIFCSWSYGQVNNSSYISKAIINGIVEIDGHETKEVFILETTLEGIKIYDRDKKQEYKLRKCTKDNCNLICICSVYCNKFICFCSL